MPPIKIKLSLSSASLLSNASSSTPTAAEKGKGKATPSQSTSDLATQSYATPTAPASHWAGDSPAPSAGPSRLSLTHSLGPAFSPYTPVSNSPSVNGTPGSSMKKAKARSKPKSKIGRLTKPKRLSQSAPTRPTAIPPHVYAGPSTPQSSPGQMAPPSYPWYGDTVKEEMMDGDDDGEGQVEGSPDPLSTPFSQDGEEQGTPQGRGRTGVKWTRLRKPLKELMGKIMIELRRRDEYALFSEPVNTDDFPTYLTIIGGADKMMDLSTMQNKVDNGDYRTMDQVENDLRMLVTAAQLFNPPGTVPYRSATNILTHGLKHIERNRPLVLTPSPSPTRETTGTPAPTRFSVDIDETAEPKAVEIEIPPKERIPIEMLEYPSNSLVGLAVGWNLNGGKRVWIKRDLRARERFSGKWRHFDYDGTRALHEMDDIDAVLAPNVPLKSRTMVDWKGLRREGTWWDWPGVGGVYGQPPVPFTKYPIRPAMGTRELGPMDWGTYPEMQTERKMLLLRKMNENAAAGMAGVEVDEEELFREHLRPTAVKAKVVKGRREPGAGFTNTYDARRPGEWLRDMADGDVRGEAYRMSVKRFLDGAIKVAETTQGVEAAGLEEMRRYANEGYNNGVVGSEIERTAQRTLASLAQLHPSHSTSVHPHNNQGTSTTLPPSVPPAIDPIVTDGSNAVEPEDLPTHDGNTNGLLASEAGRTAQRTPLSLAHQHSSHPALFPSSSAAGSSADPPLSTYPNVEPILTLPQVRSMAQSAHARVSLRNILRPSNPLDIAPFITSPEEFILTSRHEGMDGGLGWVARQLEGMVKSQRESAGKKRKLSVAEGEGQVRLEHGEDESPSSKRTKVEGDTPTRVRAGSSPLSTAPPSPPLDGAEMKADGVVGKGTGTGQGEEERMKAVRLEILALCKFFPLTGLKPLPKALAERVLPANVRGLLSAPE